MKVTKAKALNTSHLAWWFKENYAIGFGLRSCQFMAYDEPRLLGHCVVRDPGPVLERWQEDLSRAARDSRRSHDGSVRIQLVPR
jgi:hypothetical protein